MEPHPYGQQEDSLVDEALRFIWTQGENCLSVLDVAKHLRVTRRTLDRRFSESLGTSVLNAITECRMQRARQLLVNTKLQIKKIAFMSGFSSAERMRVAFITHEGMSPTQYRLQAHPQQLPD